MTTTEMIELAVLLLEFSTTEATSQDVALDAVLLALEVSKKLKVRLEQIQGKQELSDIPF